MTITMTLYRYLGRNFAKNTGYFILGLAAVIYLFDTLELLKQSSKFTDLSLLTILLMGLFKLPEVSQVLLPFAVFFSAMITFWQLNKRSELAVVRASGFSVWQFLVPIIGLALLFGLIQITVINPVGAMFLGRYEQMERQFFDRQTKEIALFEEGLWLRQSVEDMSDRESGYAILHAPKITHPEWILQKPTVFFFNDDDTFVRRLDAQTAILKRGEWVFRDATARKTPQDIERGSFYILPTDLTIPDIEESFSSPASMSFWQLPKHIQTLENAGFNALRLRVHFQTLLAQPLLYIALVLLAATVSMRPPRLSGGMLYIGLGITGGFVLFFFSSFLQALGASGQIPIILSAWTPAFVTALIGVSILLRLEDG